MPRAGPPQTNRIGDLFRKDPCREFYRIIKATELDPARLGQELEEYVVPEKERSTIRRDLQDILDEYIETRRRAAESVCIWVSGWFGSGKSHFLKVVGAVLGNLPIQLPGTETTVGAATYFCEKWKFPHGHTLARDFHTKTVFVNLLDYLGPQPLSLSQIVYIELMSALGYAPIPWVAEMERHLQERGLYDRFKAEIEGAYRRPWTDLRRDPMLVRGAMARALHAVDPETWPNLEIAGRSIDDTERELRINPRWVARRLVEEARRLHPERGRIVLLLDEVGLFVGRKEASQDRLGELQAIAENISKGEAAGRIWLLATAQEALEEVAPEIWRRADEFQRLRDRFRIKVTLKPENIEEVVRVRLLEKLEGPATARLRKAFQDVRGSLVSHACIHNVARDRDLYGDAAEDAFLASYPFMPYHLRLLQEVLNELRAKHVGERGYTGRERAVLGIVQSVLCSDGLLERPVGSLATFDRVFDSIEEELEILRGDEAAEIRQLANLGSHNGVSVMSVAKALYLLQHAGSWLPTVPESIAAILYPELGADGQQLLEGVRESLRDLVRAHYVGEREGQFRFLTKIERTFEQEVEIARGKAEVVGVGKKRERVQEICREVFRDLLRVKFHDVRTVDVKVVVDEEPLTEKGFLRLVVFTPLSSSRANLEELEVRSAREKDTVFVLAGGVGEFEELLEQTIAIEYVIGEKRRSGLSEEDARLIGLRERDLDILKHERLRELLRKAVGAGYVISGGQSRALGDGNWEALVQQALADRAEDVFPEFKYAAAIVREEDIDRLLKYRGGVAPEVARGLRVVDEDGRISAESPLVSRVLKELGRREGRNESTKGVELASHFDAPPYGWDGRAVRLALAALFHLGAVWVQSGGAEYHSPSQPGAGRVFVDSREFNRAVFRVGEVPPPEERERAAQLLGRLFNQVGLETLDEIRAALESHLKDVVRHGERLSSRLRDLGVGDAARVERCADRCREIVSKGTGSAIVRSFLKAVDEGGLDKDILLLRGLMEFEEGGNLDRLAEIVRFAQVARAADPDRASRIRRLAADADLPSAWPSLFEEATALREVYGDKYRSAHSHAHERVASAVGLAEDLFRAFPGLSLAESDRKPPWSCPRRVPEGLEAPTYACNGCGSRLEELEAVPALVEAWIARLRTAAAEEELKGRGGEPVPSLPLDEVVATREDLASVEARLRAFVERALGQGSKVRIRGEVRKE